MMPTLKKNLSPYHNCQSYDVNIGPIFKKASFVILGSKNMFKNGLFHFHKILLFRTFIRSMFKLMRFLSMETKFDGDY